MDDPAARLSFRPLAPAQAPIAPVAHAGPYASQLGALHFPGGEAFETDSLNCIASLPSGAVVVAGTTNGSLGEPHAGAPDKPDLFVARFDPQGALVWLSQVGAVTAPLIPALNGNPAGPGGDASDREWAADLVVDVDGSILITGGVTGSLGETGSGGTWGTDVFVARFAPNGTLQWLRQIGLETAATLTPTAGATAWGDTSGSDNGQQIVLDPAGGFWVAGSTLSNLVEDNAGDFDLFLAHFDDAGQLGWLRQLGAISGPALGFNALASDGATGLALSPFGALFMLVTSDQLNGSDIVYFPRLRGVDATASDWSSAASCGPRGTFSLCGSTLGGLAEPSAGSSDALLLRMGPNGDY